MNPDTNDDDFLRASKFYREALRMAASEGKQLSDQQEYAYHVAANMNRTNADGTIHLLSMLSTAAFEACLRGICEDEDLDTEEVNATLDLLIKSAKRSILDGSLVVRDVASLIPLNGNEDVAQWCSSQDSSMRSMNRVVVKRAEAQTWLMQLGAYAPNFQMVDGSGVMDGDGSPGVASAEVQAAQRRAAPKKFQEQVYHLVMTISRRADERGEAFDFPHMPGRKEDLFDLAGACEEYPDLKVNLKSFQQYLQWTVLKFNEGKGGRPSDAGSDLGFYRRLFPEKFKNVG